MTITEKILAAHSGRDSVTPGEIVNAKIDLIVAHDVTTPPAVAMLRKLGIDRVFDPSKILVTPDHFVPNKDIKSAELAKQLREWRIEQGIERYYEIGNHGICHAIAPEQGHVLPGMTIIWGHSEHLRAVLARQISRRRSRPANSGSRFQRRCTSS